MKLSKVLQYVEGLFDEETNEFKYFRNGNATILSTSFGVQLNFLLNNLSTYPVTKIAEKLKEQQDESTGLLIDSSFSMNDVKGFEEEYLLWQQTYFATIALDMLGERPHHLFDFLNEFKDPNALDRWLEKQDYARSGYTANKFMFLFYFFTFEEERLSFNNQDSITQLFDFLDRTQDVQTGFWGGQNGADLDNALRGASHIYLYYNFHGRQIQNREKIIDNVIALQNPSGLYLCSLGDACEDYDAIEILNSVMKQSTYKADLVNNSVYKTYKEIMKHQNRDGGFSYYLDTRTRRLGLDRLIERARGTTVYWRDYSGWSRMLSEGLKSDLWGTYFRVLAIAKAERMLGIPRGKTYSFYALPGWGHF